MSKWIAKHISSKVPFKIAIRKGIFTLTFVDLEYETSISISEFQLIIVLKLYFCLHYSSLHNKIHRTHMKMCLLMNSGTLICIWNLVFPIGIIEICLHVNAFFWFYFSSLYDYRHTTTWKCLVNTSWGAKWSDGKYVHFISSKCEKDNQMKHRNQVLNRLFIDSYVFEYEGLYLSLRGEHIRDNI